MQGGRKRPGCLDRPHWWGNRALVFRNSSLRSASDWTSSQGLNRDDRPHRKWICKLEFELFIYKVAVSFQCLDFMDLSSRLPVPGIKKPEELSYYISMI